MAFDEETRNLIRLRRVTQEYDIRRKTLMDLWTIMSNFSKGLQFELDQKNATDRRIAFVDLEAAPEYSQYRFRYSELQRIFDIAFIKEVLDNYRTLLVEKASLERELGVSMDRKK
jgi:hypothetical protein